MYAHRSRVSTNALVETALLTALAFVLSFIMLFPLPQGGTVTPLSMLPILIVGMRRGAAYGMASALVFSGLQMLQGFYPPPVKSLLWFVLVIYLDYVLAFGVLGLAGLFRRFRNGLLYAAAVCLPLRFLCHFLSGIFIWSSYAPEGMPVWLYSLTYNGSYMGAELVLTLAAGFLIQKQFRKQILDVRI